jgi:hypothetical protein
LRLARCVHRDSIAPSALTRRAAIAFTYFEALLRLADVAKFDEEEARLSSMHNLLNNAGFPHDVYIDWAEDVFDLLRELAMSLQNDDGRAADLLLQKFNDVGASLSIMTYFKVSASQSQWNQNTKSWQASCKCLGAGQLGEL